MLSGHKNTMYESLVKPDKSCLTSCFFLFHKIRVIKAFFVTGATSQQPSLFTYSRLLILIPIDETKYHTNLCHEANKFKIQCINYENSKKACLPSTAQFKPVCRNKPWLCISLLGWFLGQDIQHLWHCGVSHTFLFSILWVPYRCRIIFC